MSGSPWWLWVWWGVGSCPSDGHFTGLLHSRPARLAHVWRVRSLQAGRRYSGEKGFVEVDCEASRLGSEWRKAYAPKVVDVGFGDEGEARRVVAGKRTRDDWTETKTWCTGYLLRIK